MERLGLSQCLDEGVEISDWFILIFVSSLPDNSDFLISPRHPYAKERASKHWGERMLLERVGDPISELNEGLHLSFRDSKSAMRRLTLD